MVVIWSFLADSEIGIGILFFFSIFVDALVQNPSVGVVIVEVLLIWGGILSLSAQRLVGTLVRKLEPGSSLFQHPVGTVAQHTDVELGIVELLLFMVGSIPL